MAVRNRGINYRNMFGRSGPVLVRLPVQAGSTQAIVQGEICQLRDPSDFTTYPVIPATNNAIDFYPLIAWEEQKATDAARLMTFAYPFPGDLFEFPLLAADAIVVGDKLGCAATDPSQTLDVDAAYNIAVAWAEQSVVGTWPTVTMVWAMFGTVFADAIKHLPGLGAMASHDFGALGDLSDVGTATHTSGYILIADGTDFEGCAMSGDATLATGGALTLADLMKAASNVITDPGNAGAIPVTKNGVCKLVTTGAETRTVADATAAGQILVLGMKTDGGDCVVTFASPYNQIGGTVVTFNDAGDFAVFVAIEDGGDKEWRLAGHSGAVVGGDSSKVADAIADPGDAGAIPVTGSGSVPLVTTGAQTRTLADATFAGQLLNLSFKTDGGDCVVTSASPVNQTGNNTMTFADVGDQLLLIGSNDGVALSTV